ncbi:hypothetical protein ACQ86B_25795 [Mycolicibacterium aichiense]|uniref:hypothetical protein n=1 Tax=Mycolicibacterium aichiense TaxID=1799 RepID=UPI003D6753E7
MYSIFVGKTLRIDKSIGRIGALAVALGVGVGLGTSLTCGVAHADGSDSTSTSSDHGTRATSRGHGAGGASIGAGRRSSTTGVRGPAAEASGGSSAQRGDFVDRGRRHGREMGAPQADGSATSQPTAHHDQSAVKPVGEENTTPAIGDQRSLDGRSDGVARSRTDVVVTVSAPSPAPVATASVSAPASNQLIGGGLAPLSGTGSPGVIRSAPRPTWCCWPAPAANSAAAADRGRSSPTPG